MSENIYKEMENLQNAIGMLELQINKLLAEKSLLEARLQELLENAER